MTNGNRTLTDAIRYIRRYHSSSYTGMTTDDQQAIELMTALVSPEFDRINHGPFEHPTEPVQKWTPETARNAKGRNFWKLAHSSGTQPCLGS